jgi:hypothetical protein
VSFRAILTGFISVIFAAILLCVAILAPITVPAYLVPEAYSNKQLTDQEKDKIHLQIDIRKSLLDWMQSIFTAATAAGLIGTLWFTAKNYRVASENLRVTEYYKSSEAYFKSVELLGNKDDTSRIVGTVHALGRLGLSSRDDHRHVMGILCDYVRRMAPHRIDMSGQPADITGQAATAAELKPEIQAILDVLRARKTNWEDARNGLNLKETRLSGGVLSGVSLKYAILEDCDLRGVDFRNADLRYARIARTLLNNATFDGADLRKADLSNTNLGATRLVSVKLRGAKLNGARGTVIGTNTWRSWRQRREPGLNWEM